MSVRIDDIAANIKAVRVEVALTQRELGERVGLPQSHISKIESGTVDLQLSSLIEIARALGLELKLVPRKALPAIDGVVRSHQERSDTSRALSIIAESSQFAEKVRASHPGITETHDFQNALKEVQSVRFNPAALKALTEALQPIEHVKKNLQDLGWVLESQSGAQKLAQQFQQAISALKEARNLAAHSNPSRNQNARPAYRLEGDDA